MPTSRNNPQDLATLREDGVDSWAPQHLTAAELRAEGKSWKKVADVTGYALSTAQSYGQIPGFDDLVEHFRQQHRSDRLAEHWHHGALEALDAMRGEVTSLQRARAKVEELVAEGHLELKEAESAIEALTGDIVRASKEYLRALGFTAAERQRRKLEAEERAAEDDDQEAAVRDQMLDELDDIGPAELASLYDQRFGD
mgnify:CR=1 FL=1